MPCLVYFAPLPITVPTPNAVAPAVLGVIAAVGAKAFQYSPMMIRRFNRMIAKKNYRQAADLLEKYGYGGGLAGTEVNQLVNELRQGR